MTPDQKYVTVFTNRSTKFAAKHAMESRVMPESIDTDQRREGLIAYVDRLAHVSLSGAMGES